MKMQTLYPVGKPDIIKIYYYYYHKKEYSVLSGTKKGAQPRVEHLKGVGISKATRDREGYSSQQDSPENRNSTGKERRAGFQIMYKHIRSSVLLELKGAGEGGRKVESREIIKPLINWRKITTF